MAKIENIDEKRTYKANPKLKEAEELTDRMYEVLDILTEGEADDITKHKANKTWEENKEAYMQAILTISETEERAQRRARYEKMVEEKKNRRKIARIK